MLQVYSPQSVVQRIHRISFPVLRACASRHGFREAMARHLQRAWCSWVGEDETSLSGNAPELVESWCFAIAQKNKSHRLTTARLTRLRHAGASRSSENEVFQWDTLKRPLPWQGRGRQFNPVRQHQLFPGVPGLSAAIFVARHLTVRTLRELPRSSGERPKRRENVLQRNSSQGLTARHGLQTVQSCPAAPSNPMTARVRAAHAPFSPTPRP